jgi:protein tyrosine/serine phosphatase
MMIADIWRRIERVESRLRNSFGRRIDTPWYRFWAHVHFQLMDHGFLRILWTNYDRVSENTFRSNQPSHRRLAAFKREGGRTVVNLRGTAVQSYFLLESEACKALGLELVNVRFWARRAPPLGHIEVLLDVFDTAQRPLLMHCKSGADRASLAAAFYLIHIDGAPVAVARQQMGVRYLHLKGTKTGILDAVLDDFEAKGEAAGKSLREWATNDYDPDAIMAAFAR